MVMVRKRRRSTVSVETALKGTGKMKKPQGICEISGVNRGAIRSLAVCAFVRDDSTHDALNSYVKSELYCNLTTIRVLSWQRLFNFCPLIKDSSRHRQSKKRPSDGGSGSSSNNVRSNIAVRCWSCQLL